MVKLRYIVLPVIALAAIAGSSWFFYQRGVTKGQELKDERAPVTLVERNYGKLGVRTNTLQRDSTSTDFYEVEGFGIENVEPRLRYCSELNSKDESFRGVTCGEWATPDKDAVRSAIETLAGEDTEADRGE